MREQPCSSKKAMASKAWGLPTPVAQGQGEQRGQVRYWHRSQTSLAPPHRRQGSIARRIIRPLASPCNPTVPGLPIGCVASHHLAKPTCFLRVNSHPEIGPPPAPALTPAAA